MSDPTSVLSYVEAEELLATLKTLPMEMIGTKEWIQHHQSLARLNIQVAFSRSYYIQAHCNVATNREDFITGLFQKHEKCLNVLKDLLQLEFWKKNVLLPHLLPIVEERNGMLMYMAVTDLQSNNQKLYHEATLVNLLEMIIFDAASKQELGDSLTSVVDYCAKKFITLSQWEHQEVKAESLLKASARTQLGNQMKELDFSISISSLALFRYLTDHISDLQLNVIGRILDKYDFVELLIFIIKRKPWERRNEQGTILMYDTNQWQPVSFEDRVRIVKPQAQCWLALFNLLMDPECRRKYEYDFHRKEMILQLRPMIDEQFMDQLPIMAHMARMLDELAIMNAPVLPQSFRGIIEEIIDITDPIQEYFAKNKATIIQKQKNIFTSYTNDFIKDTAISLSKVYDLDQIQMILDPPNCAECNQPAERRCSKCKSEWYCGRACQVKHWKIHKSICDSLK